MNKTAETKQFEVKSKVDYSANVKGEGKVQMNMKYLTVVAAFWAAVNLASLP